MSGFSLYLHFFENPFKELKQGGYKFYSIENFFDIKPKEFDKEQYYSIHGYFTKDKKGFFTLKSLDVSIHENVIKAKEACPVNIISVKLK